jgi:hypothetical protein
MAVERLRFAWRMYNWNYQIFEAVVSADDGFLIVVHEKEKSFFLELGSGTADDDRHILFFCAAFRRITELRLG